MDTLTELMGHVKTLETTHGRLAVEVAVGDWAWAALDAETRWAVADAVATDGVWGVADLVLCGPALGGLTVKQFAEMLAHVEAGLAVRLAAA